MAPAKASAPFAKDERVLCFHHEMLYEAKVLDSRAIDGGSWQYKIHYKGWKNTWDDWVPQDRVRKFTEENKQLAAQLHEQMKALQGKPAPSASKSAKSKGRANGSDFSSARGSEERGSMAAQGGGRAPRRLRDYDLEQYALPPTSRNAVEGRACVYHTSQLPHSNLQNSNKTKLELQHNNSKQSSIMSNAKEDIPVGRTTRSSILSKAKEDIPVGRTTRSSIMSKVEEDIPVGRTTRSSKRSNPFANDMESDPVAKRLAAIVLPLEELPKTPASIAKEDFPVGRITRSFKRSKNMENDPIARRLAAIVLPSEEMPKVSSAIYKSIPMGRTARSSKRPNPYVEDAESEPVAKRLTSLALFHEEMPHVPAVIADYVPKNPALIEFLLDTSQHPTDFLCKLPPKPDYQYLTKCGKVKPSITICYPEAAPELKKKRNPIIPAAAQRTDSDGSTSDKEPKDPKERATRMRKDIERIHNGSIGFQEERPCRRATFTRCFANRHLEHYLTRVNIQEDGFLDRPAISLPIPDRIKAILVDDWENVTKNQQLVPLPAAHPVEELLKEYENDELPKRIPGSPEASILEEMLAGLAEYFDRCLGRILLYRFERAQYLEMIQLWEAPTGEMSGKNANQTYGAEHLCRLLVTLPELIAQTNMDQQSVTHLREEIVKMTNWMIKKPILDKYFVNEYETPNQSYIDMARGN
ncbi:hypothetical protein V496_06963 [Pseudogymnoascus sp. VKM F-4515 (FW-2607)]|nr:hypothetical protein V496_06963 [Pseudogymnoascus sp. VKM F-4515 (FW-2607)]